MSLKQRILFKTAIPKVTVSFWNHIYLIKRVENHALKVKVKREWPMKQHVESWEAIYGSGCSLPGKLDHKFAIHKAKQPRRWPRMRFWWSMLKWRNPALLLSAESRGCLNEGVWHGWDNHRKTASYQDPQKESHQSSSYLSDNACSSAFRDTLTIRPMPSQAFLQWLFGSLNSI